MMNVMTGQVSQLSIHPESVDKDDFCWEGKGRYVSFHSWINAWVMCAGKTLIGLTLPYLGATVIGLLHKEALDQVP